MSDRPNILWIVTTQWRAQACGYAGDPNARTPALDRLAAASIDFAQAVTPHPFGPFARAALLTGIASPENGVRDYSDPLPPNARTIAHTMNAQGYATAFFGKWHLARREAAASPVGEAHAKMVVPPSSRGGFGFWEGFEGGFQLNDPWLQGTRRPEPIRFHGYQSAVICGRAAEWLREPGRQSPWFAMVSLEPPHPPYAAASDGAPVDIATVALSPSVPRGGAVEARARQDLAGYYAQIEATDRAIGELLDRLGQDSAAAARTIVVFTSVHGDMHGAHGLFRKGWPYEESVRVPLLVRLPEQLGGRGGVRTFQLASLLDLPRWTEAWAGAEIRPSVGRATSFLSGREEAQIISMPSIVSLPDQCDRLWHGIRTRRRKLVFLADGTPWLFFNLEADPGEEINLARNPAYAGEIDRLRAAFSSDLSPS
jgi:arylsulfatase A-like enzyme